MKNQSGDPFFIGVDAGLDAELGLVQAELDAFTLAEGGGAVSMPGAYCNPIDCRMMPEVFGQHPDFPRR